MPTEDTPHPGLWNELVPKLHSCA